MYCKKVRDVHRPIFIIVVSLYLWSFRDMAPSARNECATTRSGSITCFSRFNYFAVSRTASIMWQGSTGVHVPLSPTEHNKVSLVHPSEKILCTICDRTFIGHRANPIEWCVTVWPIHTFSWFRIFNAARSAVSNVARGAVQGITTSL